MPLPIRIDATTLPALIFGAVLIGFALTMMYHVRRTRQRLEETLQNDDKRRLQADRQFRRRMQVAGMMAVIGLLIPLGDQMDLVLKARPLLFVFWVGGVFLLVIWMVLLALGDWVSTVVFSQVERAHLRQERRELEEEIRRYRAANNGHANDNPDDFASN